MCGLAPSTAAAGHAMELPIAVCLVSSMAFRGPQNGCFYLLIRVLWVG